MTEAEYLENICSRFGKPPAGMSLTEWLARKENAAAKKNWGSVPSAKPSPSVVETERRRIEWAAIIAKASPVARIEAAAIWGIPSPAADSRLQSLESGGLAVRVPGAKPIQWEIRPEASA
jgi:hypothetical protein